MAANNEIISYKQSTLVGLIKQCIEDNLYTIQELELDLEKCKDKNEIKRIKKEIIDATKNVDYTPALEYAYKSIKKVMGSMVYMHHNGIKWVEHDTLEKMKAALFNSIKKYKDFINEFENDMHLHEVITEFDNNEPVIDHENNFVNIYSESPYKSMNIDTDESFVELFKDFLKRVICNDRTDLYKFMLRYIGNIVRGNKNDVCLIMVSSIQGIGKSTLSNLISKLLSDDMVHSMKLLELTTWTINMKNKVLLNIDETGYLSEAMRVEAGTQLKNYISEKVFSYVGKGSNFEKHKSTGNIVITSNYPISFADGGRRFLNLKLNPIYGYNDNDTKEDVQVKNERWTRLNNPSNKELKGLYEYLANINISNFTAQKYLNDYIAKNDQVEDVVLNSAYEYMKQAYIIKKVNITKCVNTILYERYTRWCELNIKKSPFTKTNFYNALSDIGITSTVGAQNKQYYNMDWKVLKNIYKGFKYLTYAEEHENEDEDNVPNAVEISTLLTKFTNSEIDMLKKYFTDSS